MSSTSSDDFDLPSSAFPDSASSEYTEYGDDSSSSSSDADLSTEGSLAHFDGPLAACYHAVFGLAAWAPADPADSADARLRKFREFTRACFRNTWVIRTLEDFYYHSDSLLHLLRRYDFMTGYETAYTDMWARVSMVEAVTRLGRLHSRHRSSPPGDYRAARRARRPRRARPRNPRVPRPLRHAGSVRQCRRVVQHARRQRGQRGRRRRRRRRARQGKQAADRR
jgi:hypothetical protein